MHPGRGSFLLLSHRSRERIIIAVRIEANIAPVASLFGKPSRAAILTVLMDGRALPAGELARIAGLTPTAAGGHLSKLVDGKLLTVELEGRHRYYRLANADVAEVIEGLAQLRKPPACLTLRNLSPAARSLRYARTCYNQRRASFPPSS
jgi:DNA-binding transcriptional ArsR family regulator